MGTRGRKSAESLTVVTEAIPVRPDPPDSLTRRQAEVWRAVVATKPADWFTADSQPLLVAYCKAVENHERISTEIEKANKAKLSGEKLKEYEKLIVLQEKQARLMATLATKMRLTQMSRYRAETADTAHRRAAKQAKRPWES